MCPHCGKSFCAVCISRWLGNYYELGNCPYCRMPLSYRKLIHCRWLNSEPRRPPNPWSPEKPKEPKCTKTGHSEEKINIFCLDCQASMCRKCAIFDHTKTKISTVTSKGESDRSRARIRHRYTHMSILWKV